MAAAAATDGSAEAAKRPVPDMLYRKTTTQSIQECVAWQPLPMQVMMGDGKMMMGMPPPPKSNRRQRDLDRWMLVFSPPGNTPDDVAVRRTYQRTFYVLMAVNLLVTVVMTVLVWNDDLLAVVASGTSTATGARRLNTGGSEQLGPDSLAQGGARAVDAAATVVMGARGLATANEGEGDAPRLFRTFEATPGVTTRATTADTPGFVTTLAIMGVGTVSVYMLWPWGLALYSVASLLWFFIGVLWVPSFVYGLRYFLDLGLVYVANGLRSKLVANWFSTTS